MRGMEPPKPFEPADLVFRHIVRLSTNCQQLVRDGYALQINAIELASTANSLAKEA